MVGMESEIGTLDSHLVQGDVEINYTTSPDEIDIAMTNIRRLVGDGPAWYAGTTELDWDDVGVTGSKFSDTSSSNKNLLGSIYGNVDNGVYEAGGAFYHAGSQYSIIGAFGSGLAP